MLFRQATAYRVGHGSFHLMLNHVWISDGDLIRFCQRWVASSMKVGHGCRYGSSIPGPLEAQRRVAKRRMMNLTVPGAGLMADLDALMDHEKATGMSNWSWLAPTERKAKSDKVLKDTAYPLLEPEALRPAVSASACQGSHSQAAVGRRREMLYRLDTSHQWAKFLNRLALAKTANEIRDLIERHRLRLRKMKVQLYSHLVFTRLLNVGAGFDQLIEFLSDPMIHAQTSNNIGRIVRYSQPRIMHDKQYYELVDFLERTLRLGLANNSDLRTMLRCMPSIARKIFADGAVAESSILSFLCTLWGAIKTSPVLQPANVDTANLSLILCHMAELPILDEAKTIVADIFQSTTQSQHKLLARGVSTLFSGWLMGKESLISPVATPGPAQLVPIPWMKDLLNSLPTETARLFVGYTTEGLLGRTRSQGLSMVPRTILYRWIATAAQCEYITTNGRVSSEWKALEDALGLPFWSFERVAPYLDSRDSRQTSEFLLRYWIRWRFSCCTESDAATDAIMAQIMTHFQRFQLEPYQESYINIVRAFQECKLGYGMMLRRLCDYLRQLRRPEEVCRIFQAMIEYNLPISPSLISSELHQIALMSSMLAIKLYRKYFQTGPAAVNLNHCDEFMRILIHDPRIHPLDILELLRSHVLMRYLRPEAARTSQSSSLHGEPLRLSRRMRARLETQIIHYLATRYAQASHISHRQAFRYVHRCFLLLRCHRQHLTSSMTRAMTYAGITRKLLAGRSVSYTQIQYILEKVYEAEGPEVAHAVNHTINRWHDLVLQHS